MPLSLIEFVERWKASELSERQGAQLHFADLCEVLGHQHPAAADQIGESFMFEKPVSTVDDGKGFADVGSAASSAGSTKENTRTLLPPIANFCAIAKTLKTLPCSSSVCNFEW
jgi:hypothetical protein